MFNNANFTDRSAFKVAQHFICTGNLVNIKQTTGLEQYHFKSNVYFMGYKHH